MTRLKLNWSLPFDCPGCAEPITIDISKTEAECPRCGSIRIIGNGPEVTRGAERMLTDFERSLQRLSQELKKRR